MLTCLAAVAALTATVAADIPSLAAEVENDARLLTAETEITPEFLNGLDDFATDAMALSTALRAAEVEQDLPCIFRGISEDSHERVAEFQAAATPEARAMAFAGLRALLDDAILIAPMAAQAAQQGQ